MGSYMWHSTEVIRHAKPYTDTSPTKLYIYIYITCLVSFKITTNEDETSLLILSEVEHVGEFQQTTHRSTNITTHTHIHI